MKLFYKHPVWLACGVHLLCVYIGVTLAASLVQRPPTGFVNPGVYGLPVLADALFKWDAHWYTFVAEQGYSKQSIVFFPLFILLIKAVASTGLSYALAGFLVSNVCALITYPLLYRLLRLDFPEQLAIRGLLVYALFPTSFFLQSVYTEPLFLVCTFSCVYLCRRRNWIYAGLWGALAALTRNIGIVLGLFMLYESYRTYGNKIGQAVARLAFLFPLLAFLGFCLYNYRQFGDGFAFLHGQEAWGRQFGLPWSNLWHNMLYISRGVSIFEIGVVADQVLVLVALVCLAIGGFCGIQPSYLLLGGAWLLIPLLSTSTVFPLYSLARFVLVVFPVYFVLAKLPKFWYYAWLLAGAVGLIFFTAAFSSWYWIG